MSKLDGSRELKSLCDIKVGDLVIFEPNHTNPMLFLILKIVEQRDNSLYVVSHYGPFHFFNFDTLHVISVRS